MKLRYVPLFPALGVAGFALGCLLKPAPAQQAQVLTTSTAQSSFITISGGTGVTSGTIGTWAVGSGAIGPIGSVLTVNAQGYLVAVGPHSNAPPDARWHVVADTYLDDQGRIIKTAAQAHSVDPNYCKPGHNQPQDLTVEAAPTSVKDLLAAYNSGDDLPQQGTPSTPPTNLASVQ